MKWMVHASGCVLALTALACSSDDDDGRAGRSNETDEASSDEAASDDGDDGEAEPDDPSDGSESDGSDPRGDGSEGDSSEDADDVIDGEGDQADPSEDPAQGDTTGVDDAEGTDDATVDVAPPAVEECGLRTVPSTPLRRLSADEFHNTMVDLFGEQLEWRVTADSRFPPTLVLSGFSTAAEANTVNTAESNAIEDNAERIALVVEAEPDPFLRGLLPCDLPETISESDIDGCIDRYISDFGLRAARRPLTPGETTIVRSLYDTVRETDTATAAFAATIQYFVQSPALLYRAERGNGDTTSEMVPLSSYERATRLAYLLGASTPDAELLRAAAADELTTSDQVRAQADRLLDTERFDEVLGRFHRDWLETHDFDWKTPDEFPDFDGARGSLGREQSAFVRMVLDEGDGTIASLLGSSTYPVNSILAPYYGVEAPGATEDTWVPAVVPNRRGLLTQASLMATLADSGTHVIHRGAFFQTQVLCRALPALPGDVDIQGPLQDTSDLPTARERLSPLTERAECAGCHNVINPVGLAFENYDAGGQWRAQENGATIDASGSLSLDGADVAFSGPVELVEAIASSRTARECYTLNWYRSAMGRSEFVNDACSLAPLHAATAASGGSVREMILALVQTDAFLHILREQE
jgi:hypothetical protein